MTTLSPLLDALADLTATEPRPEAQATAAALRAAAAADFPPQPPSALSPGILHTAALSAAHPAANLVHRACVAGQPCRIPAAPRTAVDQIRRHASWPRRADPVRQLPLRPLLSGPRQHLPPSCAQCGRDLHDSRWQRPLAGRRPPLYPWRRPSNPPSSEPAPRHARRARGLPCDLALVRRHRIWQLPNASRS